MKNILILVDILIDNLNLNIVKNIKKKLKYFYYNLCYLSKNNNITKIDLYFINTNKYYKELENKYIYYYLLKNTYETKKIINDSELKEYDIIFFINNLIDLKDETKNILQKCEKVFLFNLLSIKYDAFEKYNYIGKETIENFTKYYNLETFTYDFDKEIKVENEYIFLDYINDPKVKQHYDYYSEIENMKIKNNEIIKINKITKKNIKININKKKINSNTDKELLINNIDSNDEDTDEHTDNSTEYFKSNVSLSNYIDEIEENSFMGIMIQCDKDIFNLIFIPNLIHTKFINEIISYSDFIDLYDNKIDQVKDLSEKKINNSIIQIENINIKNENVNGFIPLYINSKHCKIIFNNLDKYLGKIFSGYDYGADKRYYRIFYKVLMDFIFMIYDKKINTNDLTDKDLILFLNYFRFCCELSKKLGYVNGINKYLESLNETYKTNILAIEYIIAQLITLGENDKINYFLEIYNSFDNKEKNFQITIKLIECIKNKFGSWTKFLKVFEINNGYFEDVEFLKNNEIYE